MSEQVKRRKIELLGLMSRQMNGAVAGVLRKNSPRGLLTYGVSVPGIKDIVASERGNVALAEHMYNSNVREMKLAAIYIMDSDALTVEVMECWADGFASHEVMLHAASGLLWRSPYAGEVASSWVEHSDTLRMGAAAIMVASMARAGVGDDSYYAQMVGRLSVDAGSSQLVRALAAIGCRTLVLKELVLARLEELPVAISSEVAWQIE